MTYGVIVNGKLASDKEGHKHVYEDKILAERVAKELGGIVKPI